MPSTEAAHTVQSLMRDTRHTPLTERPHALRARAATRALRACLSLAVFVALTFFAAPDTNAQRKVTKEFPAQSNIRVHLHNRSGTIEVLAWKKNVIKVTATMESKAARVTPEADGEGVRIDVLRDNREDVGDINFKIMVPENSTVDINTMRGNITIRDIRGQMVRAHVSSEGDIELTGIRAQTVMAENIRGNILFDAELLNGGSYMLKSVEGDIQLRITADAGFRLTAVAPRTRSIDLGDFAGRGQFEFFNDRRKVVGKVGDGGASLNMTNGRGSIVFMQR
jgi:hypothetical protein